MKILIIAPMLSECNNFRKALDRYPINSKKHLRHEYKVETAGVGKANAAGTAALYAYNPGEWVPDLAVVIGYAAGSSKFKQGDLVIPNKALYHDAHCPAGVVEDLERIYGLEGMEPVTILTGDSFVDKKLAEELVEKFGCDVLFDMEATAVAQIFYDVNIPVLVLKLVSDVPQLDSENLQSFSEFVETHTDFSQFVYYLESL